PLLAVSIGRDPSEARGSMTAMLPWVAHEELTDEERELLAPHFTDLDGPVFALVDLPEVTKGALFARYSRSAKSLRRVFLDEFAGGGASGATVRSPVSDRAGLLGSLPDSRASGTAAGLARAEQ